MPTTAPFPAHTDCHERWFEAHRAVSQTEREAHRAVYQSELETAGFSVFETVQTIFDPPVDIVEPRAVRADHGEGSFVGLAARR